MVKDILITWPTNCDYPLWRYFIRTNRKRFNEIIIAFHNTNQGYDYREFIRNAMFEDYVHFLDVPAPTDTEDWRNVAVNAMLLHSYNAEWLWFTEQDFYPKDGFWREVGKHKNEGADVIAAYQGDRMHPCCIFIKRATLNATGRNFGIVPDVSDHFALIQKDLNNNGAIVAKIDPTTYTHLNGLSHNFTLIQRGEMPNYEVERFNNWLEYCLALPIVLNNHWVETVRKYQNNAIK